MIQKGYILLLAATTLLASCQQWKKQRAIEDDVVATLGDKHLYRSDLQPITSTAQSAEDSALLADAFIKQWAEDILFYKKASKERSNEIERLVEDYRRSLYVHAYEEQLITAKMDKTLNEDTIRTFYNDNKQRFLLKENILKGIFIVIPNNAPDKGKLHSWLQHSEDHIEEIEKYAYQYAIGYQLFNLDWCTDNQVLIRMPFELNELTGQLTSGNLVEKSDSLNTYLLQITDKHLVGEPMPFSYAESEIRRVLLTNRQRDFIRTQKDFLYHKAIENGDLQLQQNVNDYD